MFWGGDEGEPGHLGLVQEINEVLDSDDFLLHAATTDGNGEEGTVKRKPQTQEGSRQSTKREGHDFAVTTQERIKVRAQEA